MFANPLGLLGLVSLAAILGLHLYRRKRAPLVVSAVFMWQDVATESQGGRQRQPLRRSVSLLAELLAALLLTLALAGPRWSGSAPLQHYVAVIDASASLAAESPLDGTSARDRARSVIRGHLDELPSGSRVTLILTGPEPEVLAGPFAFRDEALSELERPWPILGDHAATEALLLAAEVAGGGTVEYITDQAPQDNTIDQERIRWIAVGEACSNIGITAAIRTSVPGEGDLVRVAVKNSGRSGRSVQVLLRTDVANPQGGQGAAAPSGETISLAPGDVRALKYTVPAASPSVGIRVTATDGERLDTFSLDDEAILCPPPRKTLRLASALPMGASRTLGLGAAGSAQKWAEIVADARAVAPADEPHLLITTGPSGKSPDTWTLQLQRDVAEPSHLVGPFLLDPTHGLLRGVSLDGIVWSMREGTPDPAVAERTSSTVLAYAGETPLISETIGASGMVEWSLHVDPELSNLGRSADWPILLANAAEERRRALPGPERTSLAAGERFLWRGAPQVPWDLVAPDGSVTHLAASPTSDLVTPRLDALGLWTLRASDGDGVGQEFAVSLLSPTESRLDERGSMPSPEWTAEGLGQVSAGRNDSPWPETLLIVLAAAMLGLNWWSLRQSTGATQA